MKAPGFSKIHKRNEEAWTTYNLATVTSSEEKMERPCVMPMRDSANPELLSGVVYLDFDRKEFPEGMKRKDVIKALKPYLEWVGRSSGSGVLGLTHRSDIAGLSLSRAQAVYEGLWEDIADYIEEKTGVVADRSARSPNRVVFLPRDPVDWLPPPMIVKPLADKPLLGKGSTPPTEIDRAVAQDPETAWALLGMEVGVNDCPLTGCAHETPEGHLNVGGGNKPWMAVHYDSDGQKGYSYQTLWRLLKGETTPASILGEMPWVSDAQPSLVSHLVRWSSVDRNAPLPELDMGPVGKDPGSAWDGFISSKHVTWLYGHRGTGKTWVALWLAASHVRRNKGHILWISAEMSDQRMAQRLDHMGQTCCSEKVYSLSPRIVDASPLEELEELADWLGSMNGYVVLDSAGSLRAGTDDDTFQRWSERYLNPFVRTNCGVMVLDHIRKKAKLEDEEVPGPIGTVQKQNRADAMLQLTGKMTQSLDVVLRKKRDLLYDDAEEGDVIRILTPTETDTLVFDVGMPMRAASGQRLSTREALITKAMEGKGWLPAAEIAEAIRFEGSEETLRLDLQGLVREGMLEKSVDEGNRRRNLYQRPATQLPAKEI